MSRLTASIKQHFAVNCVLVSPPPPRTQFSPPPSHNVNVGNDLAPMTDHLPGAFRPSIEIGGGGAGEKPKQR